MLSQPFFSLVVVRHHLIDFIPEGIAMVAVMEVAEFMNNLSNVYFLLQGKDLCNHEYFLCR